MALEGLHISYPQEKIKSFLSDIMIRKGLINMKMRLKDLREDADLSQKEISGILNIKQNTYSQYETGMRQIPPEMLVRLALYYNTSLGYIMYLTDEQEPYPRRKQEEEEEKEQEEEEKDPEI